jgi:hypothetical protein
VLPKVENGRDKSCFVRNRISYFFVCFHFFWDKQKWDRKQNGVNREWCLSIHIYGIPFSIGISRFSSYFSFIRIHPVMEPWTRGLSKLVERLHLP